MGLTSATWALVVVTFFAFAAAAAAAWSSYRQLSLMRGNAKRDTTTALISSEITKNFASALRLFYCVDQQYDLELARQRVEELREDPTLWSTEHDNALTDVLAYFTYTATLYAADGIDKELLLAYNGKAILSAFYILENVLMQNIRAGLNDLNIRDLAADCLAYHQKDKHFSALFSNYVIPDV